MLELLTGLTLVLTASGSRMNGLQKRMMAPFRVQTRRNSFTLAGRTDMIMMTVVVVMMAMMMVVMI